MLNLFLIKILAGFSFSQPLTERYKSLGEMFVPQFSSAPFPHRERINGHTYDEKTYSAQEHYSDSSVAIFIPKGFKATEKIDFVVYFHGWNNNIDSACGRFNLIEQFSESNKNAIFVFPEGPKNSPDSYGGRSEDKNGLKNLIDDVLKYLQENGKLKSIKVGNIVLAGHSGAYRVISFCLMRGGLTQNILDVILFDAFYGQTEKFVHWIENFDGRFINIYTDNGGTKDETESLMDDLAAWEIPYFNTEVISTRKQFKDYLKTSKLH